MSQPLMTMPSVLMLRFPVACGVRRIRGPVVRAFGKSASRGAVVVARGELWGRGLPGLPEPLGLPGSLGLTVAWAEVRVLEGSAAGDDS